MLRQAMIRILCIAILACHAGAFAADEADNLSREGIGTFEAAYQQWDADGFAKAAGQFRMAAKSAPESPAAFYWQGAAHFHRMLQLRNQTPPRQHEADAAMEDAIEALEEAVRLDARHAESHALLGTLYGIKIQGGILRAIRFGPRVQEHQKLALQSGPDNPRVRYLLGAGLYHTAKNKADYQETLDTLLMAERLFAAEALKPRAPLDPRWGLGSCRTFIGRTYLKLGRRDEAAGYFSSALAVHPADHIARRELANLNQR